MTEYLAILKKLISFNTISNESNLALIDYIEDLLTPLGFHCQRYFNTANDKANLIAQVGPKDKKGLMLCGHTDVVPVAGQDWHSNPFELIEQAERLIGRGVCDMKGYIALILAAVQTIELSTLNYPLTLFFTYDEEVGCIGAQNLLDTLKTLSPSVAFALIGEPTNSALVYSHKGLQHTQTAFKGMPGHSSQPSLGISAIKACSEWIGQLDKAIPTNQNNDFSPNHATFNVGQIEGGSAVNIIAEHCVIEWECRYLPEDDATTLNDKIKTLDHDIKTKFQGLSIQQDIKASAPGLSRRLNQATVQYLQRILNPELEAKTVSFVTEAGVLEKANIPCVVFGPGEIEQAHKANESVPKSAMVEHLQYLTKLLSHYNADEFA